MQNLVLRILSRRPFPKFRNSASIFNNSWDILPYCSLKLTFRQPLRTQFVVIDSFNWYIPVPLLFVGFLPLIMEICNWICNKPTAVSLFILVAFASRTRWKKTSSRLRATLISILLGQLVAFFEKFLDCIKFARIFPGRKLYIRLLRNFDCTRIWGVGPFRKGLRCLWYQKQALLSLENSNVFYWLS